MMSTILQPLRGNKGDLKTTHDLLLSRLMSGKLAVDELDIRFPPSIGEG